MSKKLTKLTCLVVSGKIIGGKALPCAMMTNPVYKLIVRLSNKVD